MPHRQLRPNRFRRNSATSAPVHLSPDIPPLQELRHRGFSVRRCLRFSTEGRPKFSASAKPAIPCF